MSNRALSVALISILILIAAAHFVQYLHYAISSVLFPYEIYDAEGIVWQQAMLIPGPRMYGDINKYPFIVFHYPPLFHILSRLVSWFGCTPLFAGRAISLASTLVSGAVISTITWKLTNSETGRQAGLLGSAASGLLFFCFYPIVLTSTLMRVDMLAIAFSYLGLLCFFGSNIKSWPPFLGMAFFVLGVFTKQTAIAAPLAAMAVTVLVAPRQAGKLLVFGLLLGGAPLIVLMWMTDGGFLRHLVLYNINRYYFIVLWVQLLSQAPQILLVVVAFTAIALWWRRFALLVKVSSLQAWRDALERSSHVRAMVMITLYLGVSTVMLAGLGKNGAGLSYFNEWVGLLSFLIGVLIAIIAAPSAGPGVIGGIRIAPMFNVALPALLIAQLSLLPATGPINFTDKAEARQSDELIDAIAHAEKPVLSTDMVMLMLAGKQVPWEPAIFAELSSVGRWDESQITQMIASHKFAFVVTRSNSVFTPAVADAIKAAYPRVEDLAEHIVHFPG